MIAGELDRFSHPWRMLIGSWIASAGQVQAVHELVGAGADVNATNQKGQTPL